MLKVDNLSVEFWGETTFRAVRNLSFHVGEGSFTAWLVSRALENQRRFGRLPKQFPCRALSPVAP